MIRIVIVFVVHTHKEHQVLWVLLGISMNKYVCYVFLHALLRSAQRYLYISSAVNVYGCRVSLVDKLTCGLHLIYDFKDGPIVLSLI